MTLPPPAAWGSAPLCWLICGAAVGLGAYLSSRGLRQRRPIVTVIGQACFAAAFYLATSSGAQTPSPDLQTILEAADARAKTVEASIADWAVAIAKPGDRYAQDARALQADNLRQVAKGLGMMDDPALRAAASSLGSPTAGEGRGALYVAVSLSMPPEALRALARDTQKAGGKLVLRGLVDGSFKTTLARVREIFDEHSAGGVAIDPQVFRAFDVRAAPTIIVARAAVQPCGGLDCVSEAPPADQISGNISLAAALRELATRGAAARDVSAAALDRLGG